MAAFTTCLSITLPVPLIWEDWKRAPFLCLPTFLWAWLPELKVTPVKVGMKSGLHWELRQLILYWAAQVTPPTYETQNPSMGLNLECAHGIIWLHWQLHSDGSWATLRDVYLPEGERRSELYARRLIVKVSLFQSSPHHHHWRRNQQTRHTFPKT